MRVGRNRPRCNDFGGAGLLTRKMAPPLRCYSRKGERPR